MTNKNSGRQQKPISIVVILVCWAIPMTWVAAIPNPDSLNHSSPKTEESIQKGEKLIKKFRKKYGMAPRNLNELRAYGISEKSDFHPWDSFSQRLDYLRLSDSSWYLRSFGRDGKQNTLMTTQDPVASSIKRDPGNGVIHDYTKVSKRFNPAILLGSISSQGNWHAKLYMDQISGASRLLVRHRVRKSYFMITEHNTVEEFFWLPDGYRIVFSATRSNRYQDGIYLWNLLSDQVTNIFPGQNNIGTTDLSSKSKFWMFSLAGVKENPTSILAFAAPRVSQPLNPLDFFTAENLLTIKIPENGKTIVEDQSVSNANFSSPLNNSWSPNSDISKCRRADSPQQNWCQLPLEGAFQEVLGSWQSYAEKASGGPVFSYSLMQLSTLYADSYQLLLERLNSQKSTETDQPREENAKLSPEEKEKQELVKNAELLRSYGSEIATALINLPVAPSWMRAAGWYIQDQLNSQNPLPFKMSRVTIQD